MSSSPLLLVGVLEGEAGHPVDLDGAQLLDHHAVRQRGHELVDDALELGLDLLDLGRLDLAGQLVHRGLDGVDVAVRDDRAVLVGERHVEDGAPARAGPLRRLTLGEPVGVGDREAVLVVGVGLGGRRGPAVGGRAARLVAAVLTSALHAARASAAAATASESASHLRILFTLPPLSACRGSLRALRTATPPATIVGRGRRVLEVGARAASGRQATTRSVRSARSSGPWTLRPVADASREVGDDLGGDHLAGAQHGDARRVRRDHLGAHLAGALGQRHRDRGGEQGVARREHLARERRRVGEERGARGRRVGRGWRRRGGPRGRGARRPASRRRRAMSPKVTLSTMLSGSAASTAMR